jgi:hypothetical protein
LFDGSIEFIVYNDEQRINHISIVDDDQTAFWTSVGGMGTGKVCGPLLANDSSMRMEGKDSLKMVIGKGKYYDRYLQHTYPTSQDRSDKHFMNMCWHGANSGQTIGVLIAAPDWKNYFQYTFTDSFNDW